MTKLIDEKGFKTTFADRQTGNTNSKVTLRQKTTLFDQMDERASINNQEKNSCDWL